MWLPICVFDGNGFTMVHLIVRVRYVRLGPHWYSSDVYATIRMPKRCGYRPLYSTTARQQTPDPLKTALRRRRSLRERRNSVRSGSDTLDLESHKSRIVAWMMDG